MNGLCRTELPDFMIDLLLLLLFRLFCVPLFHGQEVLVRVLFPCTRALLDLRKRHQIHSARTRWPHRLVELIKLRSDIVSHHVLALLSQIFLTIKGRLAHLLLVHETSDINLVAKYLNRALILIIRFFDFIYDVIFCPLLLLY